MLIPAATPTDRLGPSDVFSPRTEVGRKGWRVVGEVGLVGNGMGPIRGEKRISWERGLSKEMSHKDWVPARGDQCLLTGGTLVT